MNKLKQLRLENGISQKDLAKHLNVGESTISMWENNQREMDYKTLISISSYFNVSVDYLLGKTNIKNDINTSDISLDEFEVAFHGEVKDLSDDAKEKVLEYARLLKMKEDSKK